MDHDHAEVRRIVLSVVEDCSQCHQPYSIDDFRVVGRNGNLWVLAMRCPSCDAQAFVAAVVGDYGTESMDIPDIATVGFSDAEPVDENAPVTVDDVLDVHQFLESFDGDFRALFARRR